MPSSSSVRNRFALRIDRSLRLARRGIPALVALVAVVLGPAGAAPPPDGQYDVALRPGGNGVWTSSQVHTAMTTAPGTAPWSITTIGNGALNAAGLAPFDVLVISGPDRSFATASALGDIKDWVENGGILILDPLFGAFIDPVPGAFGATYRLDWGQDWCGLGVGYPDPSHPLLHVPNVITQATNPGASGFPGANYECDHTVIVGATLGAAWSAPQSVPGRNGFAMASAIAGNGAIIAESLHLDHFKPGQFHQIENMIRFGDSVVVCGNLLVEDGEDCDDGELNGTTASCCSASCTFEPDGTSCDDGDACTQTDECDGAGECVGGDDVVCAPLDQCHDAGTCDPATGVCDDPAKPDGTSCDDGDACTLDDTCQAGTCAPGGPTLLMPLANVESTLECVEQTAGEVLP